jgi:hypothetical protein
MASLIPSCPVVCVLIQTHAPGGTSLSYRIIQAVLWPVITAALVVLFIFVFRQQIASLIDRIKAATIGPARLEMGDKVVAQKPAKPKEEGVEIALQESQVNTEALRDSLEEKAEAIRLIWQAYEALAGK